MSWLYIFSTPNLIKLIEAGGYLGLFAVIFAESGLFVGFFFPGDSLLFTAGFLASQQLLNIWLLIPLMFIAAVLGDNFGYAFGQKIGPKIFHKEESLFFSQKNLRRAADFYERYGSKTIILARFVPVVRTFAPILAGVGLMRYRTFFIFNLVGGALWTLLLTLAGYFLGRVIPGVDQYLLPIILLIIFFSILPGVIEVFKNKTRP